jgi:hypothetical protein
MEVCTAYTQRYTGIAEPNVRITKWPRLEMFKAQYAT